MIIQVAIQSEKPSLTVCQLHIFITLYMSNSLKVARYSFSGSIPPKFEHKLRHQKQSFGKIATTVVLDEDENLF